jgi:branched-chain amino acid transport system permease protein
MTQADANGGSQSATASYQRSLLTGARYLRIDRRNGQLCALAAVIGVPVIVFLLGDYWVQLCITGAIDAIVLQSIGVLADRTKLFVLCPLSFASIGAWVVLQLFVWGWPGGFYFWLLLGGIAGIPFGLIMGFPALRLRGLNLAVITLSFAFALDSIFQVTPFPGSQNVTSILTRPAPFGSDRAYFVFCWLIFVVFAVILYILDRRPFGAAWRCVGRSERATAAMGLSVRSAKLGVFVISAFIAAISGGLLVGQVYTAVESNFSPVASLVLFAVALLVGSGLAEGAAVGGLMSAFAPQVLSSIHVPQDFGNILFPLGTIQVLAAGTSASASWRAAFRRMLRRRRAAHAPAPGTPAPGTTADEVAAGAATAAALSASTTPAEAAFLGGTTAEARVSAPDAAPVAALSMSPASPVSPVTAGPLALRTTGIGVRFTGVVALEDMSMEVPAGSVSGLIGPNGAGKTTLVDVVSGFIRNYDGTVEVAGRDIDGLLVHQRMRAGVRRTFQQERTIPELTAGDYVRVAARRRISVAEAASVLEFIGGPSPYDRIADIDVGTRRLVEIAGCIAARPKVLLLDEPTAGLAEADSLAVAARVSQVPAAFGCAVLLIEHDMEVVRACCSHITVMDFGKKIAEGRPEDVLKMDTVVAAYLGTADKAAVIEG